MKSIFRSNRRKNPHKNENKENENSFFSRESKEPFFNTNSAMVQTKLTVGEPGDKYEKEADTMADAVVNKVSSKPDIQNKEISTIQRESLATPQEDEKLGTAEQRMEEDKLVQEKPEVSKMGGDKEKEEEETASEATAIQTKSNGVNRTASNDLTQNIKNKSGRGKKLTKNIRSDMESSFGRDFSEVNIHTDEEATQMNKELNAQAFTHGKDIYFNTGKYNPETRMGKHLLAHELTHVIQQTGEKKTEHKERNNKIQSKPYDSNLEGETNYRFDTYRITKDDLKDSEIIERIQALNWNGLINYRDRVNDPAVKSYIQQIINSYTSHEVALGYKIDNPPFTKTINKLKIEVLPDKSDSSLGQAGITKYLFPDKIDWVTHPKTGKVMSLDFNYVVTIQSNYKQMQNREGASGYGYGTRPEDKKLNRTSLAYHEGQHVIDIINYLSENPLPVFGGKLGMLKESIKKEASKYINALNVYKSKMDRYLVEKGDCVGISIDKFNKSKGNKTQICKTSKP